MRCESPGIAGRSPGPGSRRDPRAGHGVPRLHSGPKARTLGTVILLPAAIMCLTGSAPDPGDEPLLNNGSFETPSLAEEAHDGSRPRHWTVFGSIEGDVRVQVADTRAHHGTQSCRVSSPVRAAAYQGLFQALPVAHRDRVVFRVHVLNDPSDPMRGSMYGQVAIEWKDTSGQEIDRIHGPIWKTGLSTTKWHKVQVAATAPNDAATAHLVITQFDGDAPGGGAFLVDFAEAEKQ